ncbi:CTP synthetase [Maritimibacter sp. 55A14]|uniref:CTP synthetase n=1 Tax=Maritimibacter sp. 55A14 TaxID=2174844 RepID=UPI000D621B56|nr:CTP synthetase [Maritimibacter sp. 55A14]PWE30548.1 CTP synthetase [Maritimibacter sp. 55A14]
MIRLALPVFAMAATALMGIAVIAVLTAGYDTLRPILLAAAVGLAVSLPVTWAVVRKLTGR